MRVHHVVCAAIAAALLPSGALADDPRDPTMRSAAARAKDREIIRQLNRQELARVRARDARYAEGWRAYRENERAGRHHDRAVAAYERDRTRYERDMAAWRRAVSACRAGDYAACDN